MNIRELKTPCYIINFEEYEKNISEFTAEFEKNWGSNLKFGYSVKTNNFPYMLKTAMAHGFFGEVVSPDEYEFALRCGCTEDRIIYNGPQKRDTVLSAIEKGSIVNIDNLDELELVCRHFEAAAEKPGVGLRINYDLEAECPGETTCRGIPPRFGICLENGDFETALELLSSSGLSLSKARLRSRSGTAIS